MKDTKYALAFIAAIVAPLAVSMAFKTGFLDCVYQVLIAGGTFIFIGGIFGWIWPRDIRKLAIWMIVPIAAMSLLSLAGGFAAGVDKCWVYTVAANLVSPGIGLALGRILSPGAQEM